MAHRCPICRSVESVRPLLEKNGCELHRCEPCDHIFVAPQPSDEELARIYSFAAGYQSQAAARHESASVPPKFRRSLEEIARFAPAGSLLDVGCSSGRFLCAARDRGYQVQGVELNPDTAAIARANDLSVFVGRLEDAELSTSSLDVVHLGDLIEHVREPAALLIRVRELLKPSGVVLIVTPNHDALFPRATFGLHRWLGIPWSHPTPPFHLHQFSVTSLSSLVEGCGFAIRATSFGPCSLAYELRSTGAFRPLKDALSQRRPLAALRNAAACAGISLAYSAVWAADRLALAKRRDFEMRLIATPA